MEIESHDGSRTLLKLGSEIEFGRGFGFKIDDRTVSRRHVSFQLNLLDETRVRFQVIGKNPIWVHSRKSGQVSTFKTSESGEMEIGDMFCVSAKNPIWFTLRKAEFQGEKENNVKKEIGFESEMAASLQSSGEIKDFGPLGPDSNDISHIDPVKEFGFLVIGQEFDSYPENMIRDIKNWDWFVEEPRVDNEDDEYEEKSKKAGRRKRKKRGENEDDEWTGESEEEKEQLTKTRKVQRPKYLTRSRDHHKPRKDTRSNVKNIDDEEEDENDETLEGFIVENDDVEQEEEIDEEEEEEEEFEEEEEEEEDDDE